MQLSKLLVYSILFITLSGMSNVVNAQVFEPVKWTHEARLVEGGDEYDIIFRAAIDDEWNVYSHFTPEDGPIPTNIFFDDEKAATKVGDPVEIGHKKEMGRRDHPIYTSVECVQLGTPRCDR